MIALVAFAVSVPVERHLASRHRKVLTIVRWVLIPYCAVMLGAVSPRLMGLSRIDWRVTLGFGVTLLATLTAIVAISHGTLDSERRKRDSDESSFLNVPFTILFCGAEEFYWSFLRGAITEAFILSSSSISLQLYWASWIAALLLLPEVLTQRLTPTGRLAKLSIVVLTNVLFIYTRNFWLCWTAHAAVWLIFGGRFLEIDADEGAIRLSASQQ